MEFITYYNSLQEEDTPGKPKGKKELVRELSELSSKMKRESGDLENQNIIFKEVMLIGIRKDPKKFLAQAEEIIAKYPQFEITKNNVHWTDCLIVDDRANPVVATEE